MPNHKSGKLKQENKKHKLHGKTKSSTVNPVNGRVENKRPQPKAHVNHISSKQDRLNRQKQLIAEKRLANVRLRRQSKLSIYDTNSIQIILVYYLLFRYIFRKPHCSSFPTA